MYWGKSLDQCDPKACFGIQFNLFNSKQQSNGIKNNSGLQNTLSPRKEQLQQISRSQLREKRSLRKCMSPNRSPQTISLKSSTTNNIYQTPQNKYNSPTKISVHRSPNNQVFLARQQLIKIEKQLKKFQTPLTQSTQKSQQKHWVEHSLNQNSPKINEISKFSVLNHQNQHKIQQPHHNFIKKQANQVFYHSPSHNNVIPNNFQIRRSNQPIIQFNSPTKINNFQSPSKLYQPQVTHIVNAPIIVSPQKIIPNEKKQSSTLFYQQSLSPKKGIQNICEKKQIVSQQFPTIREENQIYQQSRSEIESKNKIIPKSETEKSENHQNQEQKIIQKRNILRQFNQILFNGSQKQQKSVKFENIPLSPRSQQPSFIEGNVNHQTIELSCEQLMRLTQNKIPEQDPNVEESLVQNVGAKTFSLSPSQKYYYQRRPNHLPSIAIKLIENKLRSHNYQVSEICESNQIISSNQNYSQLYQHQNYKSKSKINDQTESRWKQLYQQDSQTFTLSKQSNCIPFKFKIQECKSQWISDGKLVGNQNLQSLESSLIELLTEDKESSNQLKKQRVRQPCHNNVIQVNIFKDRTNLHAIHSDRHCSPRKSADKKFKTLINNKVTFHSILQEEYSSSQIVKDSSNPKNSNQNLIDDHINQVLYGIPTTTQNIDRDQSTVIGKYTFQSMEQRSG